MYSILLMIIYMAFISLGLPDSLLGSAWPTMYEQFEVSLSYAGIVTMIISCGTVVSSLMSDRLTKRLGAGLVTAISVFMTAVALLGFSVSSSFIMLCFWAIPYGLGAGAVDAALNNYVALHYASRHMSWLHCFWGVGAAISPYIMGYSLTRGFGWNNGYRTVFYIQIVLTAILFISLPLWKRREDKATTSARQARILRLSEILKIPGVKLVLITFFSYCALESTAGLWASSYLVEARGIDAEMAARFASLFYLGITIGRFLSGFITDKLGDRSLIRLGLIIILIGITMVAIPIPGDIIALIGIVIIGLGCAPVYPCVIHATPSNFGESNSQAIIGVQMASAYVGTTLMPPVFGFLADYISIGFYPFYLLMFAVLMIALSEKLNATIKAADIHLHQK
jgi:fucose permease